MCMYMYMYITDCCEVYGLRLGIAHAVYMLTTRALTKFINFESAAGAWWVVGHTTVSSTTLPGQLQTEETL